MNKKSYALRRTYSRKAHTRFYIIAGTLIGALVIGIFFIIQASANQPGTAVSPNASLVLEPPKAALIEPPDETPEAMPEATEAPTASPAQMLSLSADAAPHAIEGETNPSKFGFETKMMKAGTEAETYEREDPIIFGRGDEYTQLEGVITFRGNNYRDAASWGTATIIDGQLEKMREPKETGSLNGRGGAAWTGQPLVVKWPDKTRENMKTLYDAYRSKQGFTEVILASYDGHIYFMDLETGEKTRNPITIGAPIKGTPSLDPRGYPIIYVGQGLNPEGTDDNSKRMYFRAYSLINGKEVYKFGAENKDPFALRSWQAYDSSPLIDGATDTLIEPGENGVLYTIKLNTEYDEEAGTVSMDPGPMVKYRYTTPANQSRDSGNGGRWGIEDSAVAWRNYVIFTDNAGMLQCVDLNTMSLVYANDLGDDSDVSMVLEEDAANNTFYLYTGCEYDELVRPEGKTGTAYARKIDGMTGKILWEKPFTVTATDKVDGGILASPVLGREGTNMAGLIIYNVTQEVKGDSTTSRLVALDKLTGDPVWDYDMEIGGWSPSSPVPVYTAKGKGYIIQCDKNGDVALIDGATGEEKDKLELAVIGTDGKANPQNNFEASPVVYNNTIVVASRSHYIFFITIK